MLNDPEHLQSHIEHYQRHFNYHVELDYPFYHLLRCGLTMNRSKLTEKIVQLHLRDYRIPCSYDDPEWISKLLQDQVLSTLFGKKFVNVVMNRTEPDLSLLEKVYKSTHIL